MDRLGDHRFDHWSEPSAGDANDGIDESRPVPVVDRDAIATALFDHAGLGIVVHDLDGRIRKANDRFARLVGHRAADLPGLPIAALTHPDDLARAADAIDAHARHGLSYRIEQRYRRPDGAIRWGATHVSFPRDDAGRFAMVLSIVEDITNRHDDNAVLRESEAHHRHAVELNPLINWTATPDGAIETVSERWSEATGRDRSDALGEKWLGQLHPDDVAPTMTAWGQALAERTPVDVEYRLVTPDGGYRWCRARATARFDDAGRVMRWYGTLEDIHDRLIAERDLRESERRFRLAAEAAGLGIWEYDALTDRREWSDEFKTMLGLPADTQPLLDTALAQVVPDDRPQLLALVAAAAERRGGYRFETTVRVRRADDGAERWIRTGGWRIEAPSGQLARVLVTLRDVTDERTAEERIRWTASHDGMTGLPNRGAFNERLEAAIASARKAAAAGAGAGATPLALVLFDVDHLKETNDSVGHDAGDVMLRTFAIRLRQALGPDCTLARLGGDEFAAVLAGDDRDAVVARVQAALTMLREPFTHDGRILDCQATAGASLFPDHGGDAADLLKAADIALYAAKARSRGGLLTFRAEMRADLQRRSSMIGVARDVTRDDLIRPHYQPKVALDTGRICGFEALLRWHHRHLGPQLPATIAAAFEDLDLAVALSERMLEHIVTDMRDWLDRGIDVGRIAINVSPAEFRHDTLVPRILERFHRARVPTSLIELEVTETVFLGRGADLVAEALETFSREGVRIALDDFGTGYASLTHLKAFPVDVIKIDRSFVSNLSDDPGDAAIIDAVVGLGHRLGMEVVAEGVETAAQARYLRERGCDHAQGFYYGRSVASVDVPALIAARDGWPTERITAAR